MNETNLQMILRWRKSPLEFIKEVWGLVPQPVKAGYQEQVKEWIRNTQWQEIRGWHFEKFEKGKHITWQQWLILLLVERAVNKKDKRRISIVSGHKCGKSSTLSWLILWVLSCFLDAQVGATSDTSEQIHDVLWKEIAVWKDRMPKALSNLYEWTTGYVRMKQRPETWFARARTARKESPEAIAGLHGEHVLLVVDEASGVEDIIYRSAEGSMASENTVIVLAGNGLRNLGYFYETHTRNQALWQTLSLNTEESPLATPEYIAGIIAQYGKDSDEYRIRVKGLFPATEQMDDSGWIPLITKSNQIIDGLPFIGRKKLGIDPSGEGDNKTIWVLRDNFQAKVIAKEQISSDKSIARKTLEIIKENELKPNNVVIGAFGAGMNVRAELLLLDSTMDITAINENEKPDDEEIYLNRRAEMCFRGRSWLIKGGQLVGDNLKREVEGFVYKHNLAGKKQIMDKPNLIKRIGKSPDRADAFFLTFYEGEEIIRQEEARTSSSADPYAAI